MFYIKEKAKRYIDDLKPYIYKEQIPIKKFKFYKGNITQAYRPNFNDEDWRIFNIGEHWGGRDVTVWFRTKVKVPEEWGSGKIALELVVGEGQRGGLSGAESLIYINGHPVQGLDKNHQEIYLRPEWIAKGRLDIAVKAFSGLQEEDHLFKLASLVKIEEETEDFYYRILTMLKTVNILKEDSFNYEMLLKFLNDAINGVDFRKPGSKEFYKSIKKANKNLKRNLIEYKPKKENRPIVDVVGHSHIDVAWLWRLNHTREKCSRTFSTVIHLMEQYPEYQFLQSSPQLYEFIEKDYPEIFAKIKEKIKSGRWEITGGMWVEADCNIPSGESLVRQFLFGTRYIKEKFGVSCSILWLPDVFGYSWALPQIIKKSGLKYFMTTKISWSQFNRPEYDTFNWRGLDGTEILTHFITTPGMSGEPFYTYNGVLNPESTQGIWDNYRQKDINNKLLLAYGWGDGGGGPTKEMIETGKKMQELPGIPEVRFGKAEPFFKCLGEKIKSNPTLPIWDGELYLEYHRGTYTSQAQIKKNNRFSEVLYHNIELFNSFAHSFIDNYKYPQTDINDGWKTILRNQFHDILPGSSIREVYEDSAKEFTQVMDSGQKILNNSLEILAKNINLEGEKLVVFNSLSWTRAGVVCIPWQEGASKKAFLSEDDKELFTKIVGDKNKVLRIYVPEIPALGYRAFKIVENNANNNNCPSIYQLTVEKDRIENKYYCIKLNEIGQIISIYDKEFKREILSKSTKANIFQAFEDRPMNFDAWEIDIYYSEKEYLVNDLVELVIEEKGPERGVIRFKWQFLDSTIEQRMIVYADKRRIDFETNVDWHQHQILLKVAFPVNIRSTKATYEIQFGNVERPTHWNTSWDYARFETAAQRWADLSERNYGVSLLNNCKYGYDIKGQTLRLTLIKSGIEPDPEADQGHHSFTYSLYPHQGDWFEGETTKEAYELNYPLLATISNNKDKVSLPTSCSLVSIKANSVILDTVKKAEDDDNLILRFYEYGNQRDTVKVELLHRIKSVLECNLMEEEIEEVKFDENKFELKIRPYEIKSFKIRM